MVWQPEVDDLKRRHALAEEMGGPEGIARQRRRGKLTIRERLELLVDAGSFQQMGKLKGGATYDADGELIAFIPSAAVRGLAKINGRRVVVDGQDFTIRGAAGHDDDGGIDVGHGHPDATELLVPSVHLLDGVGASVEDLSALGRTYLSDAYFYEPLCRIMNIAPVASAVLGPAAGGLAPFPPLSHFSVIAKGTGQVFPGGPPVCRRSIDLPSNRPATVPLLARNSAMICVLKSFISAMGPPRGIRRVARGPGAKYPTGASGAGRVPEYLHREGRGRRSGRRLLTPTPARPLR